MKLLSSIVNEYKNFSNRRHIGQRSTAQEFLVTPLFLRTDVSVSQMSQ